MSYKICPQCKNRNPQKATFCNSCGTDIHDVEVIAEPKTKIVKKIKVVKKKKIVKKRKVSKKFKMLTTMIIIIIILLIPLGIFTYKNFPKSEDYVYDYCVWQINNDLLTDYDHTLGMFYNKNGIFKK